MATITFEMVSVRMSGVREIDVLCLLGRSINFPVTESNNGFRFFFSLVFHSFVCVSFFRLESLGLIFNRWSASTMTFEMNTVAAGQLAMCVSV